MHLRRLVLHDFRSWASVDLELQPGPAVFVGPNGQGKTNLVEAVGYLATLGSHRVATDAPLVRQGCTQAVVRARLAREDRELLVECEINPAKINRVRVNRSALSKPRDLLGLVRAVLFAPEDLALVRGDPGERRRFLDELLVTRSPRYAAVRQDYDRVLKQRNALLKTARLARGDALRTLDVWDGHLASAGAALLAGRLALVAELAPYVSASYAAIAGTNATPSLPARAKLSEGHIASNRATQGSPDSARVGSDRALSSAREGGVSYAATISYESSTLDGSADSQQPLPDPPHPELSEGHIQSNRASQGSPDTKSGGAGIEALTEAIRDALARVRSDELDRGITLVGPHRDELRLRLGDTAAKGFASHGESWSFALALKLGAYDLLRADGVEPILILDDVFAELDSRRRSHLSGIAAGAEQTLVTAAVAEDVPDSLAGTRFLVNDGEVHPVA